MATITLRNLPDDVHRALRARAASNGRSTEAEIREILEATVRLPARLRLSTASAELGRAAGLTDDDIESIEQAKDKGLAEPTKGHVSTT